jgi:IS30 family transposase
MPDLYSFARRLITGGIASRLNVNQSTISRELRRNTGERGYRHKQASAKSAARREQRKHVRYKLKPNVLAHIQAMLAQHQSSPEQISGRLARE